MRSSACSASRRSKRPPCSTPASGPCCLFPVPHPVQQERQRHNKRETDQHGDRGARHQQGRRDQYGEDGQHHWVPPSITCVLNTTSSTVPCSRAAPAWRHSRNLRLRCSSFKVDGVFDGELDVADVDWPPSRYWCSGLLVRSSSDRSALPHGSGCLLHADHNG